MLIPEMQGSGRSRMGGMPIASNAANLMRR